MSDLMQQLLVGSGAALAVHLPFLVLWTWMWRRLRRRERERPAKSYRFRCCTARVTKLIYYDVLEVRHRPFFLPDVEEVVAVRWDLAGALAVKEQLEDLVRMEGL